MSKQIWIVLEQNRIEQNKEHGWNRTESNWVEQKKTEDLLFFTISRTFLIYQLILLNAHEVRNLWLHVHCKTEKIIPEEPLGNSSLKASMQQRQTPRAHYLSITDQLLWSHSSRLQISLVLVAYSSTISLRDVQTGPRPISPSGQSVKFTPQQVIVVDSSRKLCYTVREKTNAEIEILLLSAAIRSRLVDNKIDGFRCCSRSVLSLLVFKMLCFKAALSS